MAKQGFPEQGKVFVYDDLIQSLRVEPGTGLEVDNPATGASLASVRAYAAGEVAPLIARAEAALPGWAGRTAKDRAALLLEWRRLILEHQQALVELITAECGKPHTEAAGEIAYGVSFIEWFAEEGKRAYGEVIPHHAPGKRLLTLRQPVGVTAAITPWNFPMAMITRKVAPALAAGCPVVLKPAEATPFSALVLRDLAYRAGIPAGVFQVVPTTDADGVGKVLCDSKAVRKLSFTGSTAVGKILLGRCAGGVKRVSMELGGNAPFIVFDDADLDAAVEGAMLCKFRNTGQACVSANRFLVQDGIHDAFVEKLTRRVSQMKVGDGAEQGVEIGPLINLAGLEKVERLVEQAQGSGGKILTGGTRHSAGERFFSPTVITEVTPDMDIANTEIFGPVVPVLRFSDDTEAIESANATPYGLAAYFYTRELARVWQMMEALEFGMVAVNEGLLSAEAAPFGGMKESGMGREGSRHGLEEYMEIKYVMLGGLC